MTNVDGNRNYGFLLALGKKDATQGLAILRNNRKKKKRRSKCNTRTLGFILLLPFLLYNHIYLMPNIKSISHLSSIRTVILATVSLASSIYGHPLSQYTNQEVAAEEPEIDFGSAEFYEKLVVIMILVLTGGAFAGKND
jgi:hypothetical protein